MAKSKSFLETKAFKLIMSRIYGLGAAVVIIGALFKILHWKFANEMLMVGLFTEAGIFAISAFEPVHEETDWSLVYPELAGGASAKGKEDPKQNMIDKLNDMLEKAKIEQNTIDKLGTGLRSLGDNVNKMSLSADAAAATSEYTNKVKEAATSVHKLNDSYSKAITAIDAMGTTGEASTEYNQKLRVVTDQLGKMNSVYELELSETQNHMKQVSAFASSLTRTIENLQGTEEASVTLKSEFSQLGKNLNTLNTVYGNMLSAMGSGRA